MDLNTDDLILLEAVKGTKPRFIEGSEYYVIRSSIPDDVLTAINGLAIFIKYTKVDRLWCMSFSAWLFYRDKLITELMARMRLRSLQLSLIGPTSDDLERAPLLSPWIAILDLQYGGAILVGKQTGHPVLKGQLIKTSRLCGIDGGQTWARTVSRWYRLKNPTIPENRVEQLGAKAAVFKDLMLHSRQLQAFVAKDQANAGFSDV